VTSSALGSSRDLRGFENRESSTLRTIASSHFARMSRTTVTSRRRTPSSFTSSPRPLQASPAPQSGFSEIPHRNQASGFTGTEIPQPTRRSVKSVSVTLSPTRRRHSVSQSQCLTLSPARRPPLSALPFSLLHRRVCTPNLCRCCILIRYVACRIG
jgi:hypothetical protein